MDLPFSASMAFWASSGAHGDKTKITGTAGCPVHHQIGLQDSACAAKVSGGRFGGIEGKIPYKQFITHVMLTVLTNRCFLQTVPETPGLKSSLNQVHLRICHILKVQAIEQASIMARRRGIATVICNYFNPIRNTS